MKEMPYKCWRRHPSSTVPRVAKIYNVVTKLHSTGSALYRTKSRKRSALSEEEFDVDIGVSLDTGLKKLLPLLTPHCKLADCTADISMKFLKLRPYKNKVVYRICLEIAKQKYHTAGCFKNRY